MEDVVTRASHLRLRLRFASLILILTRRLSRELNVPRNTVWKILRFTLRKRPYHIQVLHHLEDEDFAWRRAMCYDILAAVENENLLDILFSDEATFHVCEKVHRHYSRMWAYEEPHMRYQSGNVIHRRSMFGWV